MFAENIYLFQDFGMQIDEIARAENELIMLALALSCSFSNVQLEKVLHTVDYFSESHQFKSKYRLLKGIDDKIKFIEYYYCPDCPSILNFQERLVTTQCEFCSKIYDKRKLKEDGIFFTIYL